MESFHVKRFEMLFMKHDMTEKKYLFVVKHGTQKPSQASEIRGVGKKFE